MNDQLRIAIADDEYVMRVFFQKVLLQHGYKLVVVAENGQQLAEGCLCHDPDLIIADIQMPGMHGLHAIHEASRKRRIPVILVSTHCESELLEQTQRAFVLGYLIKPIKMSDLKPAIVLAMQRAREFESLEQQVIDLNLALQADGPDQTTRSATAGI